MDSRRQLPSVGSLLIHPLFAGFSHETAVEAVRRAIEEARSSDGQASEDEIAKRAAQIAEEISMPRFRHAFNCTGVVLHTGLGRAELAESARRAVEAAAGSVTLEVDVESGERGDRTAPLRELLCHLSGAEDAFVVNNNAAAVFLAIHTLAAGKEVLLSRGESVEIGGSFRLPDVIRSAGASLVDVGTTNRTRIMDFEKAVGPNTAAILRCHPSNFTVTGFVEETEPIELSALARREGLWFLDDLGSGCLIDMREFELPYTPTVQDALKSGAHLVMASGDKLIGGPQCGILFGESNAIQLCKRNPLARALRIDKMTAAALEATLMLLRDKRYSEVPTLKYLSRKPEEIESIAHKLAKLMGSDYEPSEAEPGGGALPGTKLSSCRVRVPTQNAAEAARSLRKSTPAVFGYIQDNNLWLDMIAVMERDVDGIASAVREVVA